MKTLPALILCFALSSFAATGKAVSYKSGDETVQAMLYAPDGKGTFPGIIVIHEYWGLNDWVKEQASKLADQGYVALAFFFQAEDGIRDYKVTGVQTCALP